MRLSESVDISAVRSTVAELVSAECYDRWLVTAPDEVLVRLAAPLEMLQFQYHLRPGQDRHLVRAARVCCEAAVRGLEGCAEDFVQAVERLCELLGEDGFNYVL